ncbi:hypothetical protein B0J18DRAFT_81980 [Chaetomium sp. MPI-SDFR-AT-0129]|nr:hypothetical protein B0J18DRAFT_81980 [Chaetomium sp. MPI-SDFR-AT-0129]
MREFMHYITNAFYGATGWNDDNTYKELNVTARELIDFPLPRGLRLTLSSLATPHFATSYQLGSIGVVDGSISYLHSTVPLTGVAARSDHIPLPALLRSYRRLHDLGSRNTGRWGVPKGEGVVDGVEGVKAADLGVDTAAAATTNTPTAAASIPIPVSLASARGWLDQCGDSLFYGRLYLPQSLLEGLVVRRFSADLQVQLSAVSERSLRNGGTLLGLIQYDRGKYGIEGLASTDGGLLGFRGLYNFGGDASPPRSPTTGTPASGGTPTENNGSGNDQQTAATERERDRIYGRFSAGGEVYYGTLNKSGGTSLGLRFATLPTHRGTPLTTTLTINPLMGNISATYAVLARDYCSLATRMEFNVYSYESEWAVGMELWSNRRPAGFLLGADPRSASAREEHKPQPSPPEPLPTRPVPILEKPKKERSFQAKLEWRLDEDDDTVPALPSPSPSPSPSSSASASASASPPTPPSPLPPQTLSPPIISSSPPLDPLPVPTKPENNAKTEKDEDQEAYRGVLKARLDQNLRIGLLWEGRVKSLIFSLGSGIDLRKLDEPFRSLGMEIQFSS